MERNELPEELWESILDRLVLNDNYDDLKSPSLVCKQFLSITNGLRRNFVANLWMIGSEDIARALKRFRNLKEIVLSLLRTKSNVDYPVLKLACSGLDLQSLCFDGFQISPSADSLRKLGCTMSNLKVLRCTGFVSLRDPNLVYMADALPRLEELDIQYPWNKFEPSELMYPKLSNHMVTDAGIEAISLKLQGLRRINISGIKGCSDLSLSALSSNCVHLNEIKCRRSGISRQGICWVLCHSTTLTSLHADFYGSSTNSSFTFDYLKISAIGLRELSVSGSMVHLERLVCSLAKAGVLLEKLKLCDPNDLNVTEVTTILRVCPTLKHFTLKAGYGINDNQMSEIGRCLPNIVSVNISYYALTAAIFSIFAKECPALSKIKMRGGLSIDSLEPIQDYFVMNHVGYLDLSFTRGLNDKLLKGIVAACPNLLTLKVLGCTKLTKEGLEEILECCPQIKHLISGKLCGDPFKDLKLANSRSNMGDQIQSNQ